MAFVDTLKQPGDNERIAATCEAYVELLHSRIRHAAQNAAQFGHNSVSGYLNSDHLTGIKEEEKTELGCPVGEGNPFDFKKTIIVFTISGICMPSYQIFPWYASILYFWQLHTNSGFLFYRQSGK